MKQKLRQKAAFRQPVSRPQLRIEPQVLSETAEFTEALRIPKDKVEFNALFLLWKCNENPRIREALLLSHMWLVKKLARIYGPRFFLGEKDARKLAEQVAVEGLISALPRFNPGFGLSFGSFAKWWIIQRLSVEWWRQLKLAMPVRVALNILSVRKARGLVRTHRKREPTDAEVIAALRLPENMAAKVRTALDALPVSSLESLAQSEADGNGGDWTQTQLGRDDRQVDAGQEGEDFVLKVIDNLLDDWQLSKRERVVLMRYWLAPAFGEERLEHAEIGRLIRVSREGARQIAKRLAPELRRRFSALYPALAAIALQENREQL